MPEENEEENGEEVSEEPIELSNRDIDAVPTLMCSEDMEMMEVEDSEVKEVENRKFIFFTDTEEHRHIKYACPECENYYLYDTDVQRQGCFIATAAYGTPFSKEINVLRNFRDSYLVYRGWGKEIIKAYYKISPPIAEIIEKSENLKKIVRTCLKPIVSLFKEKSE